MIPKLKQFIEENIDLISNNEFTDVYNKIKSLTFTSTLTRLFSEAMLEARINPLNYLTEVPEGYLYESRIKSVDIPSNITKINSYSFARCLNLDELYLPEGLTYIGEGAFRNCYSLEKLHLPSTLKYINVGAFQACNNLKEITFAGTTKQWLAVGDCDGSLLQFEPIKCSDN